MSNKIGKILRSVPGILWLLLISSEALGFEPGFEDFSSGYQFELYHSWLEKGNFKIDFPAGFTSAKVVKTFLDDRGKGVIVEYDWQDWKIYDQREVLPFVFYVDELVNITLYLTYLESFIYRLNAADREFLFDFTDLGKIELRYAGKSGKEALLQLWNNFSSKRIKVEPIKLFSENDKLGFKIRSQSAAELEILFPENSELITMLDKIKLKELEKSQPAPYYKPREPVVKEKILPKLEELSLSEYIKNCVQTPPIRELLHNKIGNIEDFFSSEFPHHQIVHKETGYSLKIEPYDQNFYGDLNLRVEQRTDGINILTKNDFRFSGKDIIFENGEQIAFSRLTDHEFEQIAPFIPQLLYEHRALGSKLLNFLLIHDDIPTTLVVYGDERELYEIDSYADLLLLLNEYWRDRILYFSLKEVNKIDGFIEFKGFLIAAAPEEESCDMAEILFHLDKDFKIDLIMMILHPENKS